MDDERIERALRAGPPGEPAYVPMGAANERPTRIRTSSRQGLSGLLATTAIAASLLVGLLVIRPLMGVETGPGSHDLLAEVKASGTLRIAVTKDSPQLSVPGVGIDGFDVDVGRAIGKRLGVSVQIDPVDASEIERGDWNGRWDLAIDSAISTPDRATRLGVGRGYYTRPATVIAGAGSPIRGLADLSGKTVCATTGSLALAWLEGTLDLSGGSISRPPAGARVLTLASADDCIAAVRAGTAAAFVADWVLDVEPASGLSRVDGVPFAGVAAPAIDRDRQGSDRLLVAVDDALSGLRADGTLRSLSERRFGGQDLTAPLGN